MMRVLVIGAGNSGLAMAAHLVLKGHVVHLWNRSSATIEQLKKTHLIYCKGAIQGDAHIDVVTDDIAKAVQDVDLILVTTPANAHRDIAESLGRVLKREVPILLNPGRTLGAVEFSHVYHRIGSVHQPFIGETQTIIYTCRKTSSDSVLILAMKRDVLLCALEKISNIEFIEKLPECIRPYFVPAESMIDTSIGNVGMVLHCAPTILNAGWIENLKSVFHYYYDGITPSIAALLEQLDKERIEVSTRLGKTVESVSDWLRRTYCIDGNSLYECIQNNMAYRTIDAPKTLKHRYILEDVPCGLVPLEAIGRAFRYEMPITKLIIDLANSIANVDFRKTGRAFKNIGFANYSQKDLINFISRS